MRCKWLCFFVCIMLFMGLEEGRGDPPTALVDIDASRSMGELSSLFRSGVVFWPGGPEPFPMTVLDRFFREHKIGTVEIALDFTTMVYSRDLADAIRSLSQWDELALRVHRAGGELMVALWGMPPWLTSNSSQAPISVDDPRPVAWFSPPRDYTQWAVLVQAIVSNFKHRLGIDAKYKVWWEPDLEYWQGSEEQYFELYKYSILGARRADPQAQLGGPALSGWANRQKGGTSTRPPMLENFIRFCARTPLQELGLPRLPIDFVVWHQFNSNPADPVTFGEGARQIRSWLTMAGYPKDTPFFIGEWNSWESSHTWGKYGHPYFSPERDTLFAAAYIIATLARMDEVGIHWHSFTNFREVIPRQQEFVGDFGIVTKSGIIKPVYNAFRAIGMLGNKRQRADVTDPFLTVLATRDEGKMQLVLANFVPSDAMMMGSIISELLRRGYTEEFAKKYSITAERLKNVLAGSILPQALGTPESFEKDLAWAKGYFQMASQRHHDPVRVQIRLAHLPFAAPYQYERYVIDPTHGNSYAVREKIEQRVKMLLAMAEHKALSYLSEHGYAPAEVQWIRDAYHKGSLQTVVAQLSAEKRQVFDEAVAVYRHTYATEIDEINDWPEVKLQAVESRTLSQGDIEPLELSMMPYSVGVIVISGTP